MDHIEVRDEGSIVVFVPLTDEGREWLESHTEEDALWFGGGLCVEHRYAPDIYEGAKEEGMIETKSQVKRRREREVPDSGPLLAEDRGTSSRLGCSACEAVVVNGHVTHEYGCPNEK